MKTKILGIIGVAMLVIPILYLLFFVTPTNIRIAILLSIGGFGYISLAVFFISEWKEQIEEEKKEKELEKQLDKLFQEGKQNGTGV